MKNYKKNLLKIIIISSLSIVTVFANTSPADSKKFDGKDLIKCMQKAYTDVYNNSDKKFKKKLCKQLPSEFIKSQNVFYNNDGTVASSQTMEKISLRFIYNNLIDELHCVKEIKFFPILYFTRAAQGLRTLVTHKVPHNDFGVADLLLNKITNSKNWHEKSHFILQDLDLSYCN